MTLQNETPASDWRCRRCGCLLGIRKQGRVFLKYKAAQYAVRGDVTATCRNCAEVNEHREGSVRSDATRRHTS
jgi:hypothetical protein